MTIAVVIFDMDDLMIDSHPAHMGVMENVLRGYDPSVSFYQGPNRLKPKEETTFFGLKIPDVFARLSKKYGLRIPIEELNSKYNEVLLRDFQKFVQPMEGLFDVIDSLKEAGYRLVLASSAPRAKINIVLQSLHLEGTFEAIVSGEDEVRRGKPSPDIFLKAAEKAGANPSECLVLEDAENGVQAAKAAGMFCIGVHNARGYRRLGVRQDLSIADVEVGGLSEVSVDTIKNIGRKRRPSGQKV